MSGIVGIFRRSGAPLELPVLRSLTNFLSYRGPDAQSVWSDGPVGFGRTMLRTTREAEKESLPVSLAGRLWITADVRLDGRAELAAKLSQAGCRFDPTASDPELILHAYEAWNEACVDQLRGDFSFAVWDAPRKKLFCARDHFGIKPFFYYVKQDLFLFSNTLNCLRMHPEISDELNDAAIGDFLLFGLNCDVATTTFRDIQRLQPAHILVVTSDRVRIERYWSPPIDGRIRYKRAAEYVEHFHKLLKAAVADRLRSHRVGILLSGGLDSGLVAAIARELSASDAGASHLRAYTMVFESLFADSEGKYAAKTAEYLNIPIQYVAMDDAPLFDRWDDPQWTPPEPVGDPLHVGWSNKSQIIAKDCRIALSGEGADNLLDFQMWPYARDLWKRREWRNLSSDLAQFFLIRSFPWRGLRERAKRFIAPDATQARFPVWISEDFAERLNLHDRWRRGIHQFTPFSHPVMPRAHASLNLPHWTHVLEREDPGITRSAVEVRYPYLDLRIVEYALAIPPFPWAFEKRLIRDSLPEQMPDTIRLRTKEPLAGSPILKALEKAGQLGFNRAPCEEITKYVYGAGVPDPRAQATADAVAVAMRPLCLNFWLQSAHRRYTLTSEAYNG